MAKKFNNETLQELAEVLGGITPSAGAILQSMLALTIHEAMGRSEYAVAASAALYGAAEIEDRLRQERDYAREERDEMHQRWVREVGRYHRAQVERDEARRVAGELLALLATYDTELARRNRGLTPLSVSSDKYNPLIYKLQRRRGEGRWNENHQSTRPTGCVC